MEVKFDVAQKLKVGIGIVEDVKVEPSSPELLDFIKKTEEETRKKWVIKDLTSKGEFKCYRSLWWAYDMDPTKLRPSPEALIRRVLEGKPLYHVNNVVDAMNAVSIKYALSVGLHDMAKIKWPIDIRKARAREGFLAIGSKGEKKINGNELVVADQEKIIDLGISTSTSDLSKVTDDTKNVFVIVYAPEHFSESAVKGCLDKCCELVAKHSGGTVEEKKVLVNNGAADKDLKTSKPKESEPKMAKEESDRKDEIIGITVKKAEDFSEWYTEVIQKAELADYAAIAGCIVFRPYSYELWEHVQDYINKDIKARGHKNAYFPLFIPESFFKKESQHVEGFAPEVAWIEQVEGDTERYALRPTSEAIIMDSFSKWVRSHRDLPILLNQWCNIVRWETKVTKPFLRTREFLWQEGHTAHKDKKEAVKEVMDSLEMYRSVVEGEMAIPVLAGKKSEAEKFAGAEYTITLEAMMPDGRALQMCTSHYLGQNFAQAFGIKFLDENEESKYAHTTSWGMSTRTIGAIVMVHGDDKGLVLPPRMAPIQAVIVPIVFDKSKDAVLKKASELKTKLSKDVRIHLDNRDIYTPGWKYNQWELKGVPVRVEIGPKDLEKEQVVLVRRDTGEKSFVKESELSKKLPELLESIQKSLYDKAKKSLEENIHTAKSFAEFSDIIENKRGFVKAVWCGEATCEEEIKDKTTATVRLLDDKEKPKGKCVHCGKPAKHAAYFAKSY